MSGPPLPARRSTTLLVACSSLDLRAPYSATPAWWQLLRALAAAGVTLHVTAYHGQVPATPWWTAHPNPLRWAGEIAAASRTLRGALGGRRRARRGERPGRLESFELRLARAVAAPRWRRHLAAILSADDRIDAVLLLSVPPNHLRGVPGELRRRFGRPVLLYDGDVPASLPSWEGFATGFRIYHGADLGELDGVIANSVGGQDELRALGARSTHTLFYAADPELYAPVAVEQDIDVLFYGHSAEYRERWLEEMVGAPSRAMAGARFAVRGRGLDGLGRAERLPYLSFSRLRELIARSRINLAVTRESHARVYASSTMRPFELAMAGACIVANPCSGVEEWFEPGREIVEVGCAGEAVERYRHLLANERERRELGAAARRRALAEHTWSRRAAELLAILDGYR